MTLEKSPTGKACKFRHPVPDCRRSRRNLRRRAPDLLWNDVPKPITTIDLSGLAPGLTGSADLVVGAEHTAPSIGSGLVPVLATPVMINLIEAAALAAVEHLLPAGHQSLGIHLDVRHFAATPIGMRVRATAELTAVDRRTLTFRVEARDEREPIGDGSHQRVVVNVARFDERVQAKLGDRK
jgi:fluoroacetyl-CoA thioesterase